MKKLIGMIGIVGLAASVACADSVRTWNGDDGAPVFRVQNSGTEAVSITVPSGAASVTVTNGTIATTITVGDAGTLATLAAAVRACTNSAGVQTLTVDEMCGLAADVVSNMMVAGTITISSSTHTWVNGPKWDTSGTTHFDTYYPGSEKGGVGDPKVVTHLFGNAAGTGNRTIVGYVDRVEVFHKVIVSPIYVNATTNGGLMTADNVTPGVFDLGIDLPVGRSESVLFRTTCTTTATDSGGMGMILDLKKD